MELRTAPLTAAELGVLAWTLPSLAVLVLAQVMFDVVAGPYVAHAEAVVANAPARRLEPAVLRAAFGWGTTALVYIVVAAGSLVVSVVIVGSRVRGAAVRPFRRLALAVTVVGLGHLALVDTAGLPLRAIFHVTSDALVAVDVFDPVRTTAIRLVVGAINVMSITVPAVFLAAAAATALPPVDGWSEAGLVRRIRQVKDIVGVAAAFMVAGVFHMGAWTHWADALLPGAELGSLATGVTLYWGAVFTLMIAAFYVPTASVLRRLAEAEMDRQAVALGERSRWLADRGLSFEAPRQLPQIAAMAAPLLAGPLSEAVRVGVGTLGL